VHLQIVRENKWRAAPVKSCRNWLDALPTQVRVEHGCIATALVENGERLVERTRAARYRCNEKMKRRLSADRI
jgi:hypothetical protein